MFPIRSRLFSAATAMTWLSRLRIWLAPTTTRYWPWQAPQAAEGTSHQEESNDDRNDVLRCWAKNNNLRSRWLRTTRWCPDRHSRGREVLASSKPRCPWPWPSPDVELGLDRVRARTRSASLSPTTAVDFRNTAPPRARCAPCTSPRRCRPLTDRRRRTVQRDETRGIRARDNARALQRTRTDRHPASRPPSSLRPECDANPPELDARRAGARPRRAWPAPSRPAAASARGRRLRLDRRSGSSAAAGPVRGAASRACRAIR
jgi:hypothetical protein